ncbi:MAG: xanthine dehydrogenase family protein molybdopterin-binding subunit [Pseudomonadota bacterium]
MTTIEQGESRTRTEDARLITGQGTYLDDVPLGNPACLRFLRSPVAAARIRRLDTQTAAAMPGVLAVFTIADLDAAGVGDVPASDVPATPWHAGHNAVGQPPLAREHVRYEGEPIVAVVAESRAIADAAIEAIELSLESTAAVASKTQALGDGAPLVHTDVPGNVLGVLGQGDSAATDAAFESAARVVTLDLINNRLAPCAIEPRGAAATYDAATGDYVLYQGCQGVHSLKGRVLQATPIEPERLRVVCPDVGGGFGLKMFLQCETLSVLHATRTTGRPVKWVADRRESFLSDLHGRDHETHAELALDDDGKFQALRVHIDSNVGAYQSQAGAMIAWIGAYMTTGCYTIPEAHARVRVIMTNTVPVDAYRGAGRPEAAYLIERLVDKAAREVGLTPDEIRRRNFIQPGDFPYRVPTGQVYDSGEYERQMDLALARSDWQGFAARRDASAERGRLRGIGLSYYVEICAGFGNEEVDLHFGTDGRLTVRVGTQSTGQGHETAYAQLAARELGIEVDAVRVLQGDTRLIRSGEGTGGSRTMAIGGSALIGACARLRDAARAQAAAMADVNAATVVFADGALDAGGTALSLADVAQASYDDATRAEAVAPGLAVTAEFEPKAGTFPNGCHICEVDIDPETGHVEILRYTVQDDFGNVINPLLLEGQVVGGVAQGLGQALMERALYSTEDGLLLSDSFMGYAMPSAEDMPNLDFAHSPVPSPRNPLGLKGAGEAGTIGAPPALVNAVVDALYESGVDHIDMPVSAAAVWHALNPGARQSEREAA